MIKVNLSKAKVIAGAEGMGQDALSLMDQKIIQQRALLRLLGILFPVVALYFWEFYSIPDLQKKLSTLQQEMNTLQAENQKATSVREEIKKIEEDREKLKAQIDRIEHLSKSRMKEVKLLEFIQKQMPDRVWLTRLDLKENKDGVRVLLLQGQSAADTDIGTFIANLESSTLFIKVTPGSQRQRTSPKGTVYEFQVDCEVPGDDV